MITKVKFKGLMAKDWKSSRNKKASMHSAGVQFLVDNKIVKLIPFSEIKEIVYGQ